MTFIFAVLLTILSFEQLHATTPLSALMTDPEVVTLVVRVKEEETVSSIEELAHKIQELSSAPDAKDYSFFLMTYAKMRGLLLQFGGSIGDVMQDVKSAGQFAEILITLDSLLVQHPVWLEGLSTQIATRYAATYVPRTNSTRGNGSPRDIVETLFHRTHFMSPAGPFFFESGTKGLGRFAFFRHGVPDYILYDGLTEITPASLDFYATQIYVPSSSAFEKFLTAKENQAMRGRVKMLRISTHAAELFNEKSPSLKALTSLHTIDFVVDESDPKKSIAKLRHILKGLPKNSYHVKLTISDTVRSAVGDAFRDAIESFDQKADSKISSIEVMLPRREVIPPRQRAGTGVFVGVVDVGTLLLEGIAKNAKTVQLTFSTATSGDLFQVAEALSTREKRKSAVERFSLALMEHSKPLLLQSAGETLRALSSLEKIKAVYLGNLDASSKAIHFLEREISGEKRLCVTDNWRSGVSMPRIALGN